MGPPRTGCAGGVLRPPHNASRGPRANRQGLLTPPRSNQTTHLVQASAISGAPAAWVLARCSTQVFWSNNRSRLATTNGPSWRASTPLASPRCCLLYTSDAADDLL